MTNMIYFRFINGIIMVEIFMAFKITFFEH